MHPQPLPRRPLGPSSTRDLTSSGRGSQEIQLTRYTYRKKFAKLKVQFEVRMRDSEALIREELRIQDISKRIQEQNEYATTQTPCERFGD